MNQEEVPINNVVCETAAQQRLQRKSNVAKLHNRREHHVEIHQPGEDEEDEEEANEPLKPITRRVEGTSRKILYLKSLMTILVPSSHLHSSCFSGKKNCLSNKKAVSIRGRNVAKNTQPP